MKLMNIGILFSPWWLMLLGWLHSGSDGVTAASFVICMISPSMLVQAYLLGRAERTLT